MTDFSGPKNDGLEQMVWRAAKAERVSIVAVAAPMAADTVFITVKQESPATFREHVADLAKTAGFEVRFAMVSDSQSGIIAAKCPSSTVESLRRPFSASPESVPAVANPRP